MESIYDLRGSRQLPTSYEPRHRRDSGHLAPCGGAEQGFSCAPRLAPFAMGRRKIEIERIDNERHRQVTFTKRKMGLIKKATELGILCDAQVAVIIFSDNEKLSLYSSAPLEELIQRYREHPEMAEVCPSTPLPTLKSDRTRYTAIP